MISNLIIAKAQLFMDGTSIFATNSHLIVGNRFLISILKLTSGKKVLCNKTLDMNITYFCFCISNALPFLSFVRSVVAAIAKKHLHV